MVRTVGDRHRAIHCTSQSASQPASIAHLAVQPRNGCCSNSTLLHPLTKAVSRLVVRWDKSRQLGQTQAPMRGVDGSRNTVPPLFPLNYRRQQVDDDVRRLFSTSYEHLFHLFSWQAGARKRGPRPCIPSQVPGKAAAQCQENRPGVPDAVGLTSGSLRQARAAFLIPCVGPTRSRAPWEEPVRPFGEGGCILDRISGTGDPDGPGPELRCHVVEPADGEQLPWTHAFGWRGGAINQWMCQSRLDTTARRRILDGSPFHHFGRLWSKSGQMTGWLPFLLGMIRHGAGQTAGLLCCIFRERLPIAELPRGMNRIVPPLHSSLQ
ncbi:hypothetical protein LX32DRAFT_218541 [Colletotrichum zoysiae]|uniref:Uncharacterized protein n=1 Tax=Colletotrichum zoysiae TaxID=1216348 RepID=A0AAD9M837_9PEZI|nr:hypothetical protein LX32DRAFT_218541 [Colletotrichum zoysiae]